jgi:hypothetical protein
MQYPLIVGVEFRSREVFCVGISVSWVEWRHDLGCVVLAEED